MTDLTAVCRRVNLTEWGRCSFSGGLLHLIAQIVHGSGEQSGAFHDLSLTVVDRYACNLCLSLSRLDDVDM